MYLSIQRDEEILFEREKEKKTMTKKQTSIKHAETTSKQRKKNKSCLALAQRRANGKRKEEQSH